MLRLRRDFDFIVYLSRNSGEMSARLSSKFVCARFADGWKFMGIILVKCALIWFPVSRFSMRALWRMTQLCRGRRILGSLTCLGPWLVAVGNVPRFDLVRMFWTLVIDSCTSDFCPSCDWRVAELFLVFSLLAERFS
jgi:hypothetical protein